MVVALWTGTTGRLDKVPTEDVLRFESEFLDFLRRSHSGILSGIRETQKFDDGADAELEAAYNSFLNQFETSEGGAIKVGHEPEAEALEDEDQEQIVKQKRG
jgi:F-type H+-transporting ATPase subunit alpha